MRTVDVARAATCSVQQVRKLEASGVIPAATRTSSGYRDYQQAHVSCLLAYQSLGAAVGPLEAAKLLRDTVTKNAIPLADIDAAHAALHRERLGLEQARAAIRSIAEEPVCEVSASDAMRVGQLAVALDVRPSTLRHWESEGLIRPPRSVHGYRTYDPVSVRDARLVQQLRTAGYGIEALREVLPTLAQADTAGRMLDEREVRIQTRSAALVQGTIDLSEAVRDLIELIRRGR